jgi:AcrR family transcriptional regulator
MVLFQDQGFEKTSVSQIVKQAGMAQGTFYLYFKSKTALVTAIAKEIFDQQLHAIKKAYEASDGTLAAMLQILVDVTFEITRKHKDVISFLYSGFAYDRSFSTWEEIYRPYYDWLASVLAPPCDERHPNRSHLANFIVGLVEHGAEACYLSGWPEEDIQAYKKNLHGFLLNSVVSSQN